MKELKLIDRNFPHTEFTTQYQSSDKVKWIREFNAKPSDIVVLTDDEMITASGNYRKVGMIMEPRAIKSYVYDRIAQKNWYSKFETILTYDKELLAISDTFEFYPHCGCWIQPELQRIYEKSELLSIVASDKSYTEGHTLRHSVVNLCRHLGFNIDCFGSGYQPIEHKILALEKYYFTVVIENSKLDFYFTEKLMDAFRTGTIPIYWGCPSIGDFFNLDGMIILDDLSQLNEIIASLSPEKYNSMLEAVKENFILAEKYLIVEEWLYATNNGLVGELVDPPH
jgi:hypothetical protein